jgi:hypothetical protein
MRMVTRYLIGLARPPMYSVTSSIEIAALPDRTLLEGTSWYQHGLWPAQYWRHWSTAVVHGIHLRVFQEIKRLAEHP